MTTYTQYFKEYYKLNRESIAEYYKEWYFTNKESILEKRKENYTCECGSVIRLNNKARHQKSNKHQAFLEKKY
jgi:hypothetical protein